MEPQETSQNPAPAEQPQQKPVTNQSQNQTATIAAAIITSAAMIAIVLIIVLKPSKAATGSNPATAQQQAQTQQQQPAVSPDITKVNTAGEPFIGNANAPVTMAYWFDYQCPFCREDEETVLPEIITNYVDTGKVKIVFKDYAFLGSDSLTLGEYARAVWAADPSQFYTWHKAIFDNQGTENTGWATTATIDTITSKALGASMAAKVEQLVQQNGTTYEQEMNADKSEGVSFGIDGTPAALIGTQIITGAEPYTVFQQALDAQLNK